MKDFSYHTAKSSPDGSEHILSNIERDIGFIPNIFAIVAESEQALNGLVSLNTAFNNSSFSPEEKQIILLATSTTNECVYCVAGHTAFSENLDISIESITAMRDQMPTGINRYDVLTRTVKQLIHFRGRVPAKVLSDFLNAGFSKAQFLELIMGICVKTFTNYVSNALNVKLDEAFKPFAWQRPSETKQQVA